MMSYYLVITSSIALAVSLLALVCVFFRSQRYRRDYFLLLQTMENIRDGFVILDNNNNYISSNPAAADIFPEIKSLTKGESISSVAGWSEELKNMEESLPEFTIDRESISHYMVSKSPVMSNHSNIGNVFLFMEITDNVNLMKELENAAYIDSLTGIYNRKHFSELATVDINRALRQNQTIYAAMLDLDFFKNVNDTHGHAAGDMVLKKTADIIHQTIRSYDLVGRYGGEEFVLLFTDLDLTEAVKLMERIRENMEGAVTLYEDIGIRVKCSIGLAKFLEGDSLESTIKKADEALYAAKNSGRNRVVMWQESTARVHKHTPAD